MTEISLIKKLIARNIPGDELITGNIKRVYPDKKYDVSTGGTEVMKRVKPCPQAVEKIFNVGDAVLLMLPGGMKCNAEIWDHSNTAFPEEHLHEFSNEPEAEVEGTLYLLDPSNSQILPYSLDGTAGTAMTGMGNELYYTCTDGTYIYFSFYLGYVTGRIRPDGTDYSSICNSTYYSSIYGLAVKGEYLYTADESSGYITRITIADGTIDSTWKELSDITFSTIKDLRGDNDYLYILYNDFSSQYIAKYDYSGNYQGSVSL